MELFFGEDDAKMRDRHVIHVDMVAVFLRLKGLTHKVHRQVVSPKIIFDVILPASSFLGPDHFAVEVT